LREWIKKNKEKLPKVTHYDNVDENGVYHDGDIANTKFGGYIYEVLHPTTKKPCKVLDKGFRFPQETMDKMIKNNDIVFGDDETTLIKPKKRIENVKDMLRTIIYEDGRASTKIVDTLLGRGVFNNPKSHTILMRLIDFVTELDKNDIILDFFAGSGTTAHAVMAQNLEDGGNRKYILVQLPEATDENSEAYKAGYTKISDITKERIKRVIKKLDYQDGFKSYVLDSSNFQVFKELKKRPGDSFDDIVKMLKMSIFTKNIFTQSAKEIDIVYEVGLKNGFSLSAKNETIKGEKYSFIKLYEEDRAFYFCFAPIVHTDIGAFIPTGTKLICFDKALDDSTKQNLREKLDLETL
jgi:adenine-specific DNA-methyltransferase